MQTGVHVHVYSYEESQNARSLINVWVGEQEVFKGMQMNTQSMLKAGKLNYNVHNVYNCLVSLSCVRNKEYINYILHADKIMERTFFQVYLVSWLLQ